MGTYILSVIAELDENLAFLKYFSPFKYFDPAMLHESKLDFTFVALSIGILVVAMAGTYLAYAKRDLHT